MILAGIDEAGLGPSVGPLATACAAFRVPEDWPPESPWKHFGETRPAVADSKVIYRKGGIGALEKTLAAFARDAGGMTIRDAQGTAEPHPCYENSPLPEPLRGGAPETRGAETVRLEAGRLFETAMNGRFAAGLNKNQILLMETGARLKGLADAFPEEPLLAVVDKQGGRNSYLPFLTELFPGAWVETLAEGVAASSYRVRRGGGADAEIRFAAKGDRDSFATALASMAAKYVRERAMAELNSWFGERVPGLKKTAGYPLDAKRWRGDVLKIAGADALETLMLAKVWRVK